MSAPELKSALNMERANLPRSKLIYPAFQLVRDADNIAGIPGKQINAQAAIMLEVTGSGIVSDDLVMVKFPFIGLGLLAILWFCCYILPRLHRPSARDPHLQVKRSLEIQHCTVNLLCFLTDPRSNSFLFGDMGLRMLRVKKIF